MSSTRKVEIILSILIMIFSSCRNPSSKLNDPELLPALPVVDAGEVGSLDQTCSNLVHAHIDAWKSRDVENLKQIYTDDIVHFDGEPAFIGIDEVTQMAKNMWAYFPNWEMKAGETYISNDKCFGEWINWDIFVLSEDKAAIEYDLLELKDSRIYFWRLFYDQKFHDIFNNFDYVDEDLLRQFAATWTKKSVKEIESLYQEQGNIEDTLFRVSVQGSDEISDFIKAFVTQFPNAEWRLLYLFAEDEAGYSFRETYPFASQGGVFTLSISEKSGSQCEIRLVLVLTSDNDGKIIRQEVFYEAESLIECGLAN